MYVLRWMTYKSGTGRVRQRTYSSFRQALIAFVKLDDDAYVERVDWIADKGDGAPAREGETFETVDDLRDWFNNQKDADE